MYENPIYTTQSYNAADFGNGTITRKVRPPRGRTQGRVAGIQAHATETFNQVTTQAEIQVGITGDLDKFAALLMGALAAGDAKSDGDQSLPKPLKLDGQFDLTAEGVAELLVTLKAPTGGTPTGIADVDITFAWF